MAGTSADYADAQLPARLVAAAQALCLAHGLAAVSLADVARYARLPVRTVEEAFPTGQAALVPAVLAAYHQRIGQALAQHRPRQPRRQLAQKGLHFGHQRAVKLGLRGQVLGQRLPDDGLVLDEGQGQGHRAKVAASGTQGYSTKGPDRPPPSAPARPGHPSPVALAGHPVSWLRRFKPAPPRQPPPPARPLDQPLAGTTATRCPGLRALAALLATQGVRGV